MDKPNSADFRKAEPDKTIIEQIDQVNGCEIGLGLDALRTLVDMASDPEGRDRHIMELYPLLECVRSRLQQAKDRIEGLCGRSKQFATAKGAEPRCLN